jgi:hypothetical protein
MIVFVVMMPDEFGETLPRMRIFRSRILAEKRADFWRRTHGLECHLLRMSVNESLCSRHGVRPNGEVGGGRPRPFAAPNCSHSEVP